MRLGFIFKNHNQKPIPFRQKSNYEPPVSTNRRIEDYVHALKIETTKLWPHKTISHNLSLQERQALRDLSRNKDLVIKKADKGSTIVILDKKDYMTKGFKHLSDLDTYKKLDQDTTGKMANKVVSTVRTLYQDGVMDHKTAEYLLPPKPCKNPGNVFPHQDPQEPILRKANCVRM